MGEIWSMVWLVEPIFSPINIGSECGYRSIILKAGAESDPVTYGGLSSTNGNIDNSGNAKASSGPLWYLLRDIFHSCSQKKWFSFRFQYEEGFLGLDKQAITNAHLHHKNLYLRNRLSPTLVLTVGVEHYVFWGGNSPVFRTTTWLERIFQVCTWTKWWKKCHNKRSA